ncbi:response regulator [Rhizomicrobium electricum]|jgi:CheY-like chemotaxis protein|nr:response regulator [Rhizomicrobium electricum]
MDGLRFDKLRILVVDDNQHMRKLVVAVLQAVGVRDLFEAADGEHAWRALRDTNPDIIVLDWQMDGMTGLEFARLVRNSPRSPNVYVPIIMLTGHTHVEHVRQARDAGVNEFLAKPVTVKAILSRLVNVVEHPRPFIRTKTYFGPCRRRRALTAYAGPERRKEPTFVD